MTTKTESWVSQIPVSTWIMLAGAVFAGAAAWFDVKNATAMNARTNAQQQEEIEKIDDAARKAEREREKILTNQDNIKNILERLERKID